MVDRRNTELTEDGTAYDGVSALELPEEIKNLKGEIGFKDEACLIFESSPGVEFLATCFFSIDSNTGSVECYKDVLVGKNTRKLRVWITNKQPLEFWVTPMPPYKLDALSLFMKDDPTQTPGSAFGNSNVPVPHIGLGRASNEEPLTTLIEAIDGPVKIMPPILTLPPVPPGPLPFETYAPPRPPIQQSYTVLPTEVTTSYVYTPNGPSWARYIDFENKRVVAAWIVGTLLLFAIVVVVRIVNTKTAVPTQSTPRVTPVTWVETDGGQ